MSPDDCARYLRVLGVPRREPSLDALAQLTTAHLTRVPFENVSKLYHDRRSGSRGIPELSGFLDGIERDRLGGTCYANNHHLNRLLETLGYDVALCGADMARPDVHLANRVRLDGRDYLVDAGYGAPLLAPLPLDLDHDREIVLGDDRYVLRPRDAEGRSRLELHRGGKHAHGYVFKPAPRHIEEFTQVVEASFDPSATFMNALVFVRFSPGRALVLHNLNLIEADGTRSRASRIPNAALLPEVLEERFGVPRVITREALVGLPLSYDPWGETAAGRGEERAR